MRYSDRIYFTEENSKIIAEKTKTLPIDKIEIYGITKWSFGTRQISLDQRHEQVSNKTVLKLYEKGNGYINKDFIILRIEQGIIPGIERIFQGFEALVQRIS